ncbi:hypothetical protein L1987_18183 [Smallanthus sonchifolius]|uniref:Uncharacterized protein n=1 Tax=Smallanthus sonchifolius TaxID=185202 RepID=A0ACB9IZ12_9ASTR|nr:hypothetical protein L1987_18183 [Smallanthus sonchifolius]
MRDYCIYYKNWYFQKLDFDSAGEHAARVEPPLPNNSIGNFTWCSHVRGGSFYQMNFGWGNPKWGTVADVLVKNTFILYDTPDGSGVEAAVSLEEEHIRLFNEELVNYVSKNQNLQFGLMARSRI